jgi:hypothetical protein
MVARTTGCPVGHRPDSIGIAKDAALCSPGKFKCRTIDALRAALIYGDRKSERSWRGSANDAFPTRARGGMTRGRARLSADWTRPRLCAAPTLSARAEAPSALTKAARRGLNYRWRTTEEVHSIVPACGTTSLGFQVCATFRAATVAFAPPPLLPFSLGRRTNTQETFWSRREHWSAPDRPRARAPGADASLTSLAPLAIPKEPSRFDTGIRCYVHAMHLPSAWYSVPFFSLQCL